MMNIKKVTLQNKIYKTEQELFRIVTLKAVFIQEVFIQRSVGTPEHHPKWQVPPHWSAF